MNPLQVSEDIVPFAEFRSQASKIMKRARETRHPVVVTQHGRPAGVIISPEDYDQWRERERVVAAIERGLSQAEAGQLISHDDLKKEMRVRYGTPSKK